MALSCALLVPTDGARADGWPLGDQASPAVQNGQPTTPLFITHDQGSGPTSGDWISAAAGGNTHYSYFIEVPTGASNLVVEILDPDVGLGGTGEGSSSSLPHFDQQRSADGATNYLLVNPAGTTVQTINGTQAAPVGSHATWFGFTTVASPDNGHWEVRVDSLNAPGGEVGGYGLRASATVGGAPRQLRVYADAHLSVQNYGSSGVYIAHPYITGYCQVRIRDFDADSDAGQIGTASTILLSAPAVSGGPAAQSQNFGGAGVLSGNDSLWQANDTTVAWHSDFEVGRPGIYTTEVSPRSTGSSNEFQVGFFNPNGPANDVDPAVPAAGASWANAWRIYLPTPDGTVDGRAPDKPYLTQNVFHVSGPNPATVGNTTRYRITVRVRNITEYPITFSASNLVRSFIPGPLVVRAAPAITVSQGTVVTDPGAGVAGQVEWDPGTVASNADAIMVYEVDVMPSAIGRIPVTGTPASNGTTAQYVDETGNTTQARATYQWGPLCELAVTAGSNPAPLPATFASVQSTRNGDRVDVRLEAAVQVGVAAYQLEVVGADGNLETVAGAFSAASADTLDSAEVSLSGRTAAEQIYVRVIDLDGASLVYGPFKVGERLGSPLRHVLIDWSAVNAEYEQRAAVLRGVAAADAVELRVTQAGIQRIEYADVVSAAASLASAPVADLALTRRGAAVAIRVDSADALFNAGDAIEFVADGRGSLYDRADVYRLERAPALAQRIAERRVARALGSEALMVDQRVELAVDRGYSFSSPLVDDPWFMDRLVAQSGAPLVQRYSLTLPVAPNGSARLWLRLWGGIDYSGPEPDHMVEVRLNGALLDTLRFDGVQAVSPVYELPAGSLSAGDQTIELRLPVPANPVDIVHVDALGLDYGAAPTAAGGQARFLVAAGDYVSAPAIDTVYSGDFDAPTARESCASAGPGGACRRIELDLPSSARVYRAAVDGTVEHLTGFAGPTLGWDQPLQAGVTIQAARADALHRPQLAAAAAPVQLAGRIDVLVIAHPHFVEGLAAWQARREAQGLRVRVVDTAAAYARYSGGNIDPAALARLIADAQRIGARAVMLVGGDTYDYHDRLGLGSRSFVPTLYTRTHPVVAHAPSDALLTDIDGDRIPDLAIGRLPVRTTAELSAALGKIEAFERGGESSALFVADQADANGNDFAAVSDYLQTRTTLPSSTAYLGLLGIDQVRSRVMAASQAGVEVIHYLGHSSLATWSSPAPGVLAPADIYAGALAGTPRPTVLLQWGCWNSYHVAPRYDTLGHAWLLGPGAAAAVLGAASLTEAEHDAALSQYLLTAWTEPGMTLGAAVHAAKRQLALSDPQAADVLLGTTLLGDPTLRLR